MLEFSHPIFLSSSDFIFSYIGQISCLLLSSNIDIIRLEISFIIIILLFLLDIFFIYISNAISKVPYTLPQPCSPTHPRPLLGPGIPQYWGI